MQSSDAQTWIGSDVLGEQGAARLTGANKIVREKDRAISLNVFVMAISLKLRAGIGLEVEQKKII